MKRIQLWGVILCSALLVAFLAVPMARADGYDKMTFLTFSGPVEVPGHHGQPTILPAGTYTFKLMESQSNRHVVMIYDKDQMHLITTVLAITNYRLRPTGHTVIRFTENTDGTPDAIKAWFYPGDNFGQEFVYPKKRALELTQYSTEPVPTMDEDDETVPAEPAPTVSENETTPAPAAEPTPQPTPQPAPAATPTPAPTTPPNTTDNELPQTGSDLPLIAAGGCVLLGLGFGLRLLGRL